jgi:predicted DCC family thiol-disulfide oxidoreductase YuxK
MGADSALNGPVILFDGVCNLCNGSVNFIIRRDPQAKLKFASLQSEFGQQQIKKFDLPGSEWNSVLLIKNGQLYQKSDAALQIVRMLTGFWPILYAFKILPVFIRDFIYDWIAKNRYRWFGRQEECMIPTPDMKARFVN